MPMHRINPSFKSMPQNSASSEGMRTSRSDSAIFSRQNERYTDQSQVRLDLQDWFSWCQTCKHVGHLEHIEEWFSSHTECPVSV